MNKVINISLAGRVFALEEPAYNKLSQYLDALQKQFSEEEGADEIMTDLENRIADLLDQRQKKTYNNAISLVEVEEIMTILGKPEEIAGKEPQQDASPNDMPQDDIYPLMRNPFNKFLGGVCSGLALRLDIDPLLIRALFLALLIPYGFALIAYLIMWIIIPKPKTESQINFIKNQNHQLRQKLIFRNPNHSVLGGVCAGLGTHFALDPIWFRIFFVLTVLFISGSSFFSSGILLYIALWILMPLPKTEEEKMKMKWKIPRFDTASAKLRNAGNQAKESMQTTRNFLNTRTPEVRHAVYWLMTIGGIILAVALTAAFANGLYMLYDAPALSVGGQWSQGAFLAITGIYVLILLPLLMLIDYGLSGINPKLSLSLASSYTVGILMIISFGVFAYGTVNFLRATDSQFSWYETAQTHNFEEADTNLTIKVHDNDPLSEMTNFATNFSIMWGSYSFSWAGGYNDVRLDIQTDETADKVTVKEALNVTSHPLKGFNTDMLPDMEPRLQDSVMTFRTQLYPSENSQNYAFISAKYEMTIPPEHNLTFDSSARKFYQIKLNDEVIDLDESADTNNLQTSRR